jgi:(3R)-3-[(carboxylmethyl)amino]fatty acid synthase
VTTATEAQPVSYPTDEELMARVLRCYRPNCRYLTAMTVSVTGSGDSKDVTVRGFADLAIGESCYIDETGHLNAVEVNIAYNQMCYYVVAKSVQERLGPVFSTWTMDDYWRRQLPDILITSLVSRFRRPIDRSRFCGGFELGPARQRRLTPAGPPLIALPTVFRFWDDRDGCADGEVAIAIVSS